MLYHSFSCRCVSYGIIALGTTAAEKYLNKFETKLNNIVRTITWNKIFLRVTQLYKNLKLLKLRDGFNLELAKFMHQLYNYKIFFSLQDKFIKLQKIHSYKTIENQAHQTFSYFAY